MRHTGREGRGGSASGFSLVEMLVVVGIMMVLAAISMPAIGRYFRLYKIRGAAQQVAGAMQQARNRAITKNVNRGVTFVIQDQTRYWVHVEDDQSAAHSSQPVPLVFTAPNPNQSTSGTLPEGVNFATSASQCPASVSAALNLSSTYNPTTSYFRFNRLGAWCGGTNSGCDPLPTGTSTAALLLMPNAATTSGVSPNGFVCLYQPATGLSIGITVGPGGRVKTQR